ncbi:hypothetical protein C1I98_35780, partial [Spongiactinospora gelatinilytica]
FDDSVGAGVGEVRGVGSLRAPGVAYGPGRGLAWSAASGSGPVGVARATGAARGRCASDVLEQAQATTATMMSMATSSAILRRQ